jgi:CelD/BcsL family acetyltransferase involved in cellulose biosynthesis
MYQRPMSTPISPGSGPARGTADSPMTVRVDVVDDPAGFARLEAEWNALLDASPDPNVFLTWEWVSIWWAVYGGRSRLHVLVARDGEGRLQGIAPLKRRRLSVLGMGFGDVIEFIGSGGDVTPERLDFIIRTGAEKPVAAAFAEALAADATCAGIDLQPFAATSKARPFVLAAFRDGGPGAVSEVPHSVCPILTLPATWDAFIQARSRNYRKKIGEYQRRCARDHGATLRWTATPAELERDMTVLIDLHTRRWAGESRAFRTPQYIEFHRRFAERLLASGKLRLFVLESRDGPLAALYCFAQGERYSFYQSGRDPDRSKHRPGLVLMHGAIQHAIEEGSAIFDFLRGGETYKYIWAGEEQASVQVEHWRTAPARMVARAGPWLRSARRLGASAAAVVPPDAGGAS